MRKMSGSVMRRESLMIEDVVRKTMCEQPDPTATEMVFTFETLMNKYLRKVLLQRDVKSVVDSVAGYREVGVDTLEGANYHTLLSDPNERTYGQVLWVTPEELAVLDEWEDQYKRVRMNTEMGKSVWVYVLQPQFIVDYGKNTDVDLSDDDKAMIDAARQTSLEILGDKAKSQLESKILLRESNDNIKPGYYIVNQDFKLDPGGSWRMVFRRGKIVRYDKDFMMYEWDAVRGDWRVRNANIGDRKTFKASEYDQSVEMVSEFNKNTTMISKDKAEQLISQSSAEEVILVQDFDRFVKKAQLSPRDKIKIIIVKK